MPRHVRGCWTSFLRRDCVLRRTVRQFTNPSPTPLEFSPAAVIGHGSRENLRTVFHTIHECSIQTGSSMHSAKEHSRGGTFVMVFWSSTLERLRRTLVTSHSPISTLKIYSAETSYNSPASWAWKNLTIRSLNDCGQRFNRQSTGRPRVGGSS